MTARESVGLTLFILLMLLYPLVGHSHQINHWEAIVIAENQWNYHVGNSEPPSSWFEPSFIDSSWLSGPGGIGYGDNDDRTIIETAYSVYLRREFNIVDTSLISLLYLFPDYDDAFVAYLNGVEICRSNIGTVGEPPEFDALPYEHSEAVLYRGRTPESYMIDKSQLNNGSNILAVQVNNNGRNSSDISSLMFLIAAISDDSNNYQALPSWFEEPFASSNLPIFVINTGGQPIVDEPKITATLGLIDNGEGNINYLTDEYNNYNGNIGIEIRGNSSQEFPKKSYGFETRLENGENNNVSLLGLPKENDWILYAPYSDKSLMRNVISYHMCRLTGEYAPRTRWCELVINNQYMGLYVFMEKIKRDKNRVDISKLKKSDTTGVELTGGYIIVKDWDDGIDDGWLSPFHSQPFYRYVYPKVDDIQPQQRDYIENHVTQFERVVDTASSLDKYRDLINIPSFVNYWIVTEISKHIDNYKYSFFMYKTKDDKGGEIHFGPLWDINLGFGNYDFSRDPGPEGWCYTWANSPYLRPFWIYSISEESEIQNLINCTWNELRQSKLHTDSLLNFIDAQAEIIEEAQIRNFERWPILDDYVWPNSYIGETYANEIKHLKTWVYDRLEWMDINMIGSCDLSLSDDFFTSTPSDYQLYQNYPNPFNPNTTISYDIPEAADVTIDIYALSGHKIATIFSAFQEAGNYSLSYTPGRIASGVYLYRIKANNWTQTKKMLFMK